MKIKAIKQEFWAEHENSDRREDVGDIPAERIHATRPEGIPDCLIEYCVELYLPGSFKDWGQRHIPGTEIEIDLSEYDWTEEDGADEQTLADWLVEVGCQMTNEAAAQHRLKQ